MPTITNWKEFVSAATPFLSSTGLVEAMAKKGFHLGGPVAEAFSRGKPKFKVNPSAIQELVKIYGPPPEVRLHLQLTRNPIVPAPFSGYHATGSIDMSAINPVLAELWSVGTIPNELSDSQTSDVINFNALNLLCTGVPPGANALGGLLISTAPVASASTVSPNNLHLDIGISLPVVGDATASLDATLHVELPLGLETFSDGRLKLRVSQTASGDGGVVATLEVSPDSQIQPKSPDALIQLQDNFSNGVKLALIGLSQAGGPLLLPAEVYLPTFPNTFLQVSQIPGQNGAATVLSGSQSLAVLGINFADGDQNPPAPDPASLASAALPVAPYNVHAMIDEKFATDVLMAFIKSGDLATFFNKFLDRHTLGLSPEIDALNGSVTFQDGSMKISVAMVARGACLDVNDLNFTVSTSGPPSVSNGFLGIGAGYLDMTFDTVDELVCLSLSGLIPLVSIFYTGVFAYLETLGPLRPFKAIPVNYTFAPLPGSEMDWSIVMKTATASPGILMLDGVASLFADPRTIVCLRVLYIGGGQPVSAIANASVTLFELDDPAPAHDDVKIPPTGLTHHGTARNFIEDQTSYQPSPDQNFGTLTTNDTGFVVFFVTPNNLAGYTTTTQTQTDLQTGKILSEHTSTDAVYEAKPDFGVTITDASGNVLATRRLIALNLVGNRLGTMRNPYLVKIERKSIFHRNIPNNEIG